MKNFKATLLIPAVFLFSIVEAQNKADSSLVIREAVVSARKGASGYGSGTIVIPSGEIKSSLALLGEADILKVIQLLPGVQAGTEGLSGIYVRGGGADENLILLDGITDPHNLGAIIRTAECTGVHGIIIPQHRSVGLTPSAVKSSAGAVEYVKVARVNNLSRTIEYLQQKNIWMYAVTMNGNDYREISFKGGVALVIGAEEDGISRLVAEKCDYAVSLPMTGKIESLNASVAAGIMMYRVLECRK